MAIEWQDSHLAGSGNAYALHERHIVASIARYQQCPVCPLVYPPGTHFWRAFYAVGGARVPGEWMSEEEAKRAVEAAWAEVETRAPVRRR